MITALFSIIIGVAVCFLCFWLRERMSIFTHLVDLVPGPDKKFIVGNMFDFPRDGYGKYNSCAFFFIPLFSSFCYFLKIMINIEQV